MAIVKEVRKGMDEVSKYQLIGAAIWLGLLILIVPSWYNNPVNFSPDSEQGAKGQANKLVVYQAYTLPTKKGLEAPTLEAKHEEAAVSTKGIENTVKNSADKPVAVKAEVQLPSLKAPAESAKKPSVAPASKKLPELKSGQWLVKIYSSNELKDANKVVALLESSYKPWIKTFPETKTYSVRTGPYASRALAEADKIKIDKAIRTQAEIVQVK